mmetsp:Transcript_7706/g.20397  ORF Transcript_7706/g.20397 Transcript_7706/m.20397 type:complete len:505 (+) Transcript_7706:47-1561(+)
MSAAGQGGGDMPPIRFDPVTGQILTGPPPEPVKQDRPRIVLSPRASQMLSPRRSSRAADEQKASMADMPEYVPPPKETSAVKSPRASMKALSPRNSGRFRKTANDTERAAIVADAQQRAVVYFPGEFAGLGELADTLPENQGPLESVGDASAGDITGAEAMKSSGDLADDVASAQRSAPDDKTTQSDAAVEPCEVVSSSDAGADADGELSKVKNTTSGELVATDTMRSSGTAAETSLSPKKTKRDSGVRSPTKTKTIRAVGVVPTERVAMKAIGGPELENARGQDEDKDIVAFYHDGFRAELRDLHAMLTKWEGRAWKLDSKTAEIFFSWWAGFKNAVFDWYTVDERVFITHMETFQASLMEFDGSSRARKRLDFIAAAQAVDAEREGMLARKQDALSRFVPAIQTCFPALLGYFLLKEEMMTRQIKIARGSNVLQEKHLVKMDETMARETLKCKHGALMLCLYVAPLNEAERTAWIKSRLPFLQARKFPSLWSQFESHRAILK